MHIYSIVIHDNTIYIIIKQVRKTENSASPFNIGYYESI